jgi:hypothetical protein
MVRSKRQVTNSLLKCLGEDKKLSKLLEWLSRFSRKRVSEHLNYQFIGNIQC